MSTTALNNLLTYIQSLGLSQRNRKWLAEHILNPDKDAEEKGLNKDDTTYLESSPSMMQRISEARKELAEGKGTQVDIEDLWK